MDIERMKRLLKKGIEAGEKVKAVRKVMKDVSITKQDMYDDTAQIMKPTIDIQTKRFKKIDEEKEEEKKEQKVRDEKQDNVIEQLKENQAKIAESVGALSVMMSEQGSTFGKVDNWMSDLEPIQEEAEEEKEEEEEEEEEDIMPSSGEYMNVLKERNLPTISDIKSENLDVDKFIDKTERRIFRNEEYIKSNSKFGVPNAGLDSDQMATLMEKKRELPYLEDYLKKLEELKKQSEELGEKDDSTEVKFALAPKVIKTEFSEEEERSLKKYKIDPDFKRIMSDEELKKIMRSAAGKKSTKNPTNKKIADRDYEALKKYREGVSLMRMKKGDGIYTQKKRNAYKISQGGQYGGLIIDLPKLFGHLKVVAHKNGQKVYDKQADFDTLDLLTKRFNSNKKYSDIARTVFNDLNRLSEIPIHRTSKKFSKIGSGVVYYNNPEDLLSRLELLGGSMSAGNNSNRVREEFVNIVHKLNKLNVIDNKQMNELMKEYLI